MELKKPLTYEQQIAHLSSFHKLEIRDVDRAKDILNTIGYYRLSAYGIGLTKQDCRDEYTQGVCIEQLYSLYLFDRELREIMTRVLEFLEVKLRAQISYHLSIKYGSDGYMNPQNFKSKLSKDGSTIHSVVISHFNKECERQKSTPIVKHHNAKYDGKFPIWVAAELFTFGNIASLFDIMNDEDRKVISKEYNADPKHLNSWMLSLIEIRNICAHYGRLYNMPLKQSPHLYKENMQYRVGTINKLFPVILVIKRMLCNNSEWNHFLISLQAIMEKYSDVIKLSFIGFPQNWQDVLQTQVVHNK